MSRPWCVYILYSLGVQGDSGGGNDDGEFEISMLEFEMKCRALITIQ